MMTPTSTLEQLKLENIQLSKQVAHLQGLVASLQEQVQWFQNHLFGKRSEKIISSSREEQLLLFPLPPITPTSTGKEEIVAAHTRQKPRRNGQDEITFPDDLPVERQVLEVPESERVCKSTGDVFVKIGEEVNRKLAYRPGSYFIKEIVRPKYANPKNSDDGIMTACLPEGLLSRCQADESFIADILVKKYADHLPLYRLSEMLGRSQMQISRQTLCNWVNRVGDALTPLYDEMKKRILSSENIFVDETPIKMLDPGCGKTRTAYMWVLVGGRSSDPPYRIYDFRMNRQHGNVVEIIQDDRGVLHADKYGAYESLAHSKRFTWCPCWSHIRRKFIEAEHGDPPFRQWVLRKIRYLFMLERVAWGRSEEEHLRIRQEKEVPMIDELIREITGRLDKGFALPKSKFREALGYFRGLIPYLKNYTLHAWARIDNNIAERAVRPLAIGRKNWLFIGSEGGGEAAATIYSLIQTCRSLGINPTEYLEDVMRRLMNHNSQKLIELLPDQWAQRKQSR